MKITSFSKMIRKVGLMVAAAGLLLASGSNAAAQLPLPPSPKPLDFTPPSPFKPTAPSIGLAPAPNPFDLSKPLWTPPGTIKPFDPKLSDPFDLSKPLWTPPGTVKPFDIPLWTPPVAQLPTFDLSKPFVPAFDKKKFPEERAALISKKGDFPKLGDDFEVLGPSTGHADKVGKYGTYNCIAWSLGITGNWEWPGKSMKEFDKLYYKHGFQRLKIRNTEVRPGFEKAMVYGKVTSEGTIEVTHAARQEADGNWTSKIGGMALIKHRTPDDVAGPSYGDPLVIYVRKKN